MEYPEREVALRGGETALLRAPSPGDAQAMLVYLKTCAEETDFLLRCPEEWDTGPEAVREEARFLSQVVASGTETMIVCLVGGEIAGDCQISLNQRRKTRHRASLGIAVVRKYWGLGIGTVLIREMIRIAESCGVTQLELDYIEGNERARRLYEKLGFCTVAERPNAVRQPDGSMRSAFSMILSLPANAGL